MALTGKQIADAVVASARSSGYFKTLSRNQSRLLEVAARRVSFAQEILLRSFV
jgi:hypothetical protein